MRLLKPIWSNRENQAISNRKQCRRVKIPPPCEITVKPPDWQPSTKELNEKHDMPDLGDKQIRETFFRPFKVTEKRA